MQRRASGDLVLIAGAGSLPPADALPRRLAAIDEPYWNKGVLEVMLRADEVADYVHPSPRLHRDTDPWLELAMARNLVRGRAWLAR